MQTIWAGEKTYKRASYANEADIERAILKVQNDLFGPDRIYLDIKRKIGAKGSVRNIPDGYLIDLSANKPRLYVVEVEMASHNILRHIAVQILEFSLSFEASPRGVKSILFAAIHERPEAKKICEEYAKANDFRNLDHLLDRLVYDAPFTALVIIDELAENLENVLIEKFKFGVEILELARFEDEENRHIYLFEPFLYDIGTDVLTKTESGTERIPIDEVDTVVVPAHEDGFQETFVDENRWYAVRIHGAMRPQIKYIAAYRVTPISAITHIAPVKSIEPWKDTSKVVINFSEPAQAISPIKMDKTGRVRSFQSLRYTTRKRLEQAKTLDDIW